MDQDRNKLQEHISIHTHETLSITCITKTIILNIKFNKNFLFSFKISLLDKTGLSYFISLEGVWIAYHA